MAQTIYVETNIRHSGTLYEYTILISLALRRIQFSGRGNTSLNGNKKLTNVSQLFLNLSAHSLIYSSANVRQLLPTWQSNRGINYLYTMDKPCTRLPSHTEAVEFSPNSPLLQLPSIIERKKSRQTASNLLLERSFFDKIFIASISQYRFIE